MKSNDKPTYKELEHRINELQSEIKTKQDYKRLFENASISIWNEDLSAVFEQIEELRKLDIPNFKIYLKNNPEVLGSLIGKLEINNVNKATLKLFKAESDQEFLTNLKSTFGEGANKVFIALLESIWNKAKSFTSEVNYKTLDGDEFAALFSIPIPETKLEQQSVPVIIQSIQPLKEAERAKEDSLIKLQEAQKLSHVGSWEWKWETDDAVWSDEMYQIYGVEKENFIPSSENVGKAILKEDKHKMEQAIIKLFKGGVTEPFEFKIARPNNEIRHLNILALKIYEGTVFGVTQDITDRKKRENELNEAQKLAKIGSWLFNPSTKKVEWSDETFHMWGFDSKKDATPDPDTLIQQIHPDDQELWSSSVDKATQQGIAYDIEIRICLPDDQRKTIRVVCQPIKGIHDEVISLAGTNQDITQQKLLAMELIKAKEKAEESDRLKTAFLANMSHELRTPMNGILGFAELLKRKNLTDETKDTYLGFIEKEGNRLLCFISNIVDISKIESNVITIEKSFCNVNELIDDLYSKYSFRLENTAVHLQIKKGLDDPQCGVKTDTNKLIQVLSNLLENAMKFTKEGVIEFGYSLSKNKLEFYVKDTGIGIEKEEQKNIFNRFMQGKLEQTHNQGVGLGLSIVKGIVAILGGEVWLNSHIGVGSTFFFSIPYLNIVADTAVVLDTNNTTLESGHFTILIAEDDRFNFLYLKACLSEVDCTVLHAINGKEAVQLANKNSSIDVILMDINMPEMNGYEALEEIRRVNKEVPIIAQTGLAMSGDKEKMLQAGFNNYISKPISPKVLMTTINKHLIKLSSSTHGLK
jgi:signal transduction histidine kinase/ActR/RegA family two-component response regulator